MTRNMDLQCGAGETAVKLFEEMNTLEIEPDRITFTGLISATTASGQWEAAQRFFDMMQVSPCYYKFFMIKHLRCRISHLIT